MTGFVLGGGCFWCTEAVFSRLRGVSGVESGYAGGSDTTPNYAKVSTGKTGHAEVVRIIFDESVIPADVILDIFFLIHNPTTPNQQGADIGTQYRSVMLYEGDDQKHMFEAAYKRAEAVWDDPLVTKITPLDIFYVAEEEHQNYFNKNPDAGYCQIVIAPKITKARAAYAQWFKEE